MKKLTISEFKEYLKRIPEAKTLIADVRKINDYNTEHIDNTVNIPLADIEGKEKEYWAFETIITLSPNKHEAKQACELIKSIHPQNLYYIDASFEEFAQFDIRTVRERGI